MTVSLARLTAALADRYRIERELGQGGMATVYLARDIKHERDVAIKVLREDLAASLGGGRFLREIKIAAQLQHPNILPLLDSGEANGFLFYVMPYVSGQSLRERIAREGELPVHEAVRLITEVVDALAHAHEHGVVHRDIKPDNVMLSGRHALVADFGVAKAVSEATGRSTVTTLGVAVGTPTYMSPEQAAADPHIDHRSDIYAVGVMTYELLTGQPPFVGVTPQSVLAAHVTQAPDPVMNRRPGVAAPLDAVVMRCLAKRPADRFQSAGELLAALEPFGTPSSGITPTQTRPTTASGGSRRPFWIAGGALLVLAMAFGLWRAVSGHAGRAQAIAVLPFDNVTHDTAVDYLADGIASDVRSGLMGLPGLIVKARTSSEAARGKPVHDAGAMLNVPVILQGTYRRTADKTTVTVDLVNVADESALWSGTFTLPADGNFSAAQDSITAAVQKAMHLAAAGGAGSAEQQRGTADVQAYDDYLKGQFFFAKRGGENLQHAVDYFQRAIARDPKFARAQAGLAMVYSILPGYMQVDGGDSIPRESERFARQALALDSMLVDGHIALANALVAEAHPAAAEPEFRRALALDPRNATAHEWLGASLSLLARGEEAVREGEAAVELDPLSAVAENDLAYSLVSAGRYDEALIAAQRIRELDATFAFVDYYGGLAFAFGRRPDSAMAAFQRFFLLDSMAPEARAMHVWRFALASDWPAAEREFEALDRTITAGSRDVDIAIASVALGDRDAALTALERGARRRSFYLAGTAMGCDPSFVPLRSEPRFIAVVKEMGQGICTNTPRWPVPARPGVKP
jgi:TolB-like protein/tRNA A-37 threonylcarbamoyl transferase component Bud32